MTTRTAYAVYGKEISSGKRYRPLAVGEGFVTNKIHATVFLDYLEAVAVASEYCANNRNHVFEVRSV